MNKNELIKQSQSLFLLDYTSYLWMVCNGKECLFTTVVSILIFTGLYFLFVDVKHEMKVVGGEVSQSLFLLDYTSYTERDSNLDIDTAMQTIQVSILIFTGLYFLYD